MTLLLIIFLLAALYWLFMAPYSQVFGVFPYRGKTNKKQIALTFDDGPNEPFTSELLDFLKHENIKATFFQVGKNVERYPAVAKRAYKEGHTIGNHSLSHLFSKYFTEHDFEHEILAAQEIFARVLGVRPMLFRSPWLVHYPKLFKTVQKHHLQIVSGEFCSAGEVLQPSAGRIAKATIRKVKPGSIIIFHDGYDMKGGNRAQTIASVRLVVEALKQKDYKFVTVNQLLEIENPYS